MQIIAHIIALNIPANAIITFMILKILLLAQIAIFHGYSFILLKLFSLTCDGNTETDCLSCDSDNFRDLSPDKECLCIQKYYEVDVNTV